MVIQCPPSERKRRRRQTVRSAITSLEAYDKNGNITNLAYAEHDIRLLKEYIRTGQA